MRLYCLNGDPQYPCFVLTLKGCTVMLDCSLNTKHVLNFLPQMLVSSSQHRFDGLPNARLPSNKSAQCESIKELNNRAFIHAPLEFSAPQFNLINVSDIDAVLISNAQSMLALPYLTRMKEFRAHIYCTEPVMHLARMLMDELTQFIRQPINNANNTWKRHSMSLAQLFGIRDTHTRPHNWQPLYTAADVDQCISRIKITGFNQRIDLFGSVTAIPHSSAHSIGSCNWSLSADFDRVLYLTRSSLLSTHAKSFDNSFIKNEIIDCAIVNGLNQAPSFEPETMIQDFCKACISTLRNGGNVLVPTLTNGRIYDLIECLHRYMVDASLTTVPVYFISSVANQSLAYSNIFGEWLCEAKIGQVYAAESPFQHGELVRNGMLKVYSSISGRFNSEFRQPCVLFAAHPSLRFGDACHFVELWKNSPANAIIFTDPEYNYLECLAPYQPVYASYFNFPIDTSLNLADAVKVVKESSRLSQVVLSSVLKTADVDLGRFFSGSLVSFYGQNDVIKLALRRKFEECEIEADLASTIPLKSFNKDGVSSYSRFVAELVTKNNQHTLKAVPKAIPLTRRDRLDEGYLKKYPYGRLVVEQFEAALKQAGVAGSLQVHKSDDACKFIVSVCEGNFVLIDVKANTVTVSCDNEDVRLKIRESLLKCLNTL